MSERRRWEKLEDDYLRQNYGKLPVEQMTLDRAASSIRKRASDLGLTAAKYVTDFEIEEAMKVHHPKGWSDREIQKRLVADTGRQVSIHRIGKFRKRLGLKSNRTSEHMRNRFRAGTERRLKREGVASLGEIKRNTYNKWIRDLGWPEHLTVRAVQALELFYHLGPMTRLRLCVVMGLEPPYRRHQPLSTKGSVLAELQRENLVSRIQNQVRAGTRSDGRPIKVDLYLLKPGVEPDAQRRVKADRCEPSC